jgi:hypothetical protein
MEPQDRRALEEFVRRHHVHYEVEREEVTEPRRELVAVRLRLLARHEREKLTSPGCPACAELLDRLRAFADSVASQAGASDRAESIPAQRKLYQSSEDPGSDEVAVTLRLRCDAPEQREPGAGEDRCLAGIRERLDALGLSRD